MIDRKSEHRPKNPLVNPGDLAKAVREQLDALLNEGLEDSFPASDPPSVLRGGPDPEFSPRSTLPASAGGRR
ncbi:hypothetical protein DWF00_26390 [Bosea caraganae]|uniref:Uncharacterized protein n=1 Tax=Bosea caraganae TaxID=2763117 RepID=A0A370L9X4_9HYPH|nr:hypothetical protein [Bosea caraganae]RDJ21867.1 hypothetical protein DWF00_26390 [Bosea caraganae]RDJ28102.1 hypothetical protein DWE98_05765 [Bosea caraganae]